MTQDEQVLWETLKLLRTHINVLFQRLQEELATAERVLQEIEALRKESRTLT